MKLHGKSGTKLAVTAVCILYITACSEEQSKQTVQEKIKQMEANAQPPPAEALDKEYSQYYAYGSSIVRNLLTMEQRLGEKPDFAAILEGFNDQLNDAPKINFTKDDPRNDNINIENHIYAKLFITEALDYIRTRLYEQPNRYRKLVDGAYLVYLSGQGANATFPKLEDHVIMDYRIVDHFGMERLNTWRDGLEYERAVSVAAMPKGLIKAILATAIGQRSVVYLAPEQMFGTSRIVFEKTGTAYQIEFEVKEIIPIDQYHTMSQKRREDAAIKLQKMIK